MKIPGFPQSLLAVIFVGLSSLRLSDGAGAGRAFPIDSENRVIESFKRINPYLEWDPTNFLVDLSGQFANCRLINSRGPVRVDRLTQEGNTIGAYVDYTDGDRADVNSVNDYLRRVIERWEESGTLNSYIRGAERFGCSVRPGCSGKVAISCLFSPSSDGNPHRTTETPQAIEVTTRPNSIWSSTVVLPKALAFTPEQYSLAESITGNRWDRSHFLENLSGLETDCAMIDKDEWQFTNAAKFEQRLFGLFGSAPNRGSTPEALIEILRNLKRVSARNIGCSLIPDCMNSGQMFVVVSCIYEEY